MKQPDTRNTTLDVLAVILDVKLLLENSAVFQSQVVDQLRALNNLGYAVGVVAVIRDTTVFERTVGQRLAAAGVEVNAVRDRGFFRNLFAVAAVLRQRRRAGPVRTGYVRGIWGALAIAAANPWRPLPYVYDVRGALLDEVRARGRSGLKSRLYSGLEGWGIRRAARVSAVSRPLAEIVAARCGVDDVSVVPCCIDVDSIHVPIEVATDRRRTLGFDESATVVAYSGGLSSYQQIPAMLDLWRRLLDRPDLRFLLLTNDDPQATPALVGDLNDFGDRLVHRSLPRDQVPAVLAAADVGFMLRDGRELNRVASPVKFAEYLSAGLAVVASPSTGDVSGLILEHDVGTLVSPDAVAEGLERVRGLIARVTQDRNSFRRRGEELARARFDWSAHSATFEHFYGTPAAQAWAAGTGP
jgi:glycosyltransferase involved in cell wall biosynthesis